jgi:hypothetical protein
MSAMTSARNLQEFMLRIDRMAPAGALAGPFDLTLAAAMLQAHLDFIAALHPSPAGVRAQLAGDTAGLQLETRRLRSCLMRLWLSRTLSPASMSAGGQGEASEAYAHALNHGRAVLALAIPAALSWYDATIGR